MFDGVRRYAIDGDTSAHVLKLEDYGGNDENAWVSCSRRLRWLRSRLKLWELLLLL